MVKVKSHASVHDIQHEVVEPLPFIVNAAADGLAARGAEHNKVPDDIVAEIKAIDSLAWRVQRRLVALHIATAAPKVRHPDKSASRRSRLKMHHLKQLGVGLLVSGHRMWVDEAQSVAGCSLCCRHSNLDRARCWVTKTCTRSRQCDECAKSFATRVQSGIHPSHIMDATAGFVRVRVYPERLIAVPGRVD